MKQPIVRYYRSFEDDFIQSQEQQYVLPAHYRWIRHDLGSKLLSAFIYTLALVFSSVYCRLWLHVRFQNADTLRQAIKQGGFIYGNHTQPVGDVFNPALAAFPHRIYTVVSPSNLGIPVIGKMLPFLGALPIANTVAGIKQLNEAIAYRLQQNRCIVIYPEAHVWEYCKDIRPFKESSFKFPVKHRKPVFAMTATYQTRRFGKRPTMTIYLDGPFYPDDILSPREQAIRLQQQVETVMKQRSQESNCEYIAYRPYP